MAGIWVWPLEEAEGHCRQGEVRNLPMEVVVEEEEGQRLLEVEVVVGEVAGVRILLLVEVVEVVEEVAIQILHLAEEEEVVVEDLIPK